MSTIEEKRQQVKELLETVDPVRVGPDTQAMISRIAEDEDEAWLDRMIAMLKEDQLPAPQGDDPMGAFYGHNE